MSGDQVKNIRSSGVEAFDEGAVNPSGEDETKAFDNNPYSKWLVFANTGAISCKLTTPEMATCYFMTSANDSPERDPKNWTLQGSNDGNRWYNVDTRTNEQFTNRYEQKY